MNEKMVKGGQEEDMFNTQKYLYRKRKGDEEEDKERDDSLHHLPTQLCYPSLERQKEVTPWNNYAMA